MTSFESESDFLANELQNLKASREYFQRALEYFELNTPSDLHFEHDQISSHYLYLLDHINDSILDTRERIKIAMEKSR